MLDATYEMVSLPITRVVTCHLPPELVRKSTDSAYEYSPKRGTMPELGSGLFSEYSHVGTSLAQNMLPNAIPHGQHGPASSTRAGQERFMPES